MVGLFPALLVLAAGAIPELDQARQLFAKTDFQAAVKLIEGMPQKTGAAYELMGRSHYLMGDYKKATQAFEKALVDDRSNAAYHHWLGRAWGRRAETSSPFTAPGYASKARQHFEQAVELDPENREALADLFEYYLEAPGFLGGGFDKAAALADRIGRLDSAGAHFLQSRLAEKRKDFNRAEQALRRAVAVAPGQASRVIDLAKFLAKQGRHQESEQAFAQAEALAPDSPKVLFERAEAYVQSRRNLGEARQLLKRYLKSRLAPEDPPRHQAEKLLKQIGG